MFSSVKWPLTPGLPPSRETVKRDRRYESASLTVKSIGKGLGLGRVLQVGLDGWCPCQGSAKQRAL